MTWTYPKNVSKKLPNADVTKGEMMNTLSEALSLSNAVIDTVNEILDEVGAPDSEDWALADRIRGLANERESLAEALCEEEMRDIRYQEDLDWLSIAKYLTLCPKHGCWLTSLWICPVCGVRYHLVADA